MDVNEKLCGNCERKDLMVAILYERNKAMAKKSRVWKRGFSFNPSSHFAAGEKSCAQEADQKQRVV